jgi:hypothetical protein
MKPEHRLDLDGLIAAAEAHPTPMPIDQAREVLGHLLDERELDQQTMLIRPGLDLALAPSAWLRLLRSLRNSQRAG